MVSNKHRDSRLLLVSECLLRNVLLVRRQHDPLFRIMVQAVLRDEVLWS